MVNIPIKNPSKGILVVCLSGELAFLHGRCGIKPSECVWGVTWALDRRKSSLGDTHWSVSPVTTWSCRGGGPASRPPALCLILELERKH